MSLTVSVDVKQHFGTGHSLSLICQPTSEDMKLNIIIIIFFFSITATLESPVSEMTVAVLCRSSLLPEFGVSV